MGSQDLVNILGIVSSLVTGDRAIDQNSTEVRDFKEATSKLMAHLTVTVPGNVAQNAAAQP